MLTPLHSYRNWGVYDAVSHDHCPCGCVHPQPVLTTTGVLLYGACAVEGMVCIMVPCTPEHCEEP
jgi:hypothetical protein